MNPSQLVFDGHVNEPSFQAKVEKGMWGLADYNSASCLWPFVIIWIRAGEKQDCPDRYFFRFNLDGYPQVAPTACPWDVEKSAPLEGTKWPRGGSKINAIFNTAWKSFALYLPCDRIAQEGHPNWPKEYRQLWWQPEYTIEVYLYHLFKTLNAADYTHG